LPGAVSLGGSYDGGGTSPVGLQDTVDRYRSARIRHKSIEEQEKVDKYQNLARELKRL